MEGLFLCGACVRKRAEDQQRVVAERQRQHDKRQAAAKTERMAMNKALAVAAEPPEILRLLGEHADVIDENTCRGIWTRATASGAIEPSHDLVFAQGKEHFLGFGEDYNQPGWGWREVRRTPIWRAENTTVRRKDAEDESYAWLDGDGTVWLGSGSGEISLPGATVALTRGAVFRPTMSLGSVGPVALYRPAPRSVPGGIRVRRFALDPPDYARAVGTLLRSL